jgi:hypothetical protein
VKHAVNVTLVCMLGACGRVGFDPLDDALPQDARPPGPRPASCPQGYVRVDNYYCYRLHVTGGFLDEWTVLETDCEADGVGAHLAVIDDPTELAAIIALMESTSTEDISVGFSRRSGRYLDVTGTAAFLDWGLGEPDADGECGGVDVSNGGMEENACVDSMDDDHLCEFDGIPVDPSAF